jgi:hypothetical protein
VHGQGRTGQDGSRATLLKLAEQYLRLIAWLECRETPSDETALEAAVADHGTGQEYSKASH